MSIIDFIFGFGIGAFVVSLVLCAIATPTWKWQSEAIEHGAGQFNPKTGNFEWTTQRAEAGEAK